ncbi:unnamed protein product [Ilex paraguariensis]|uniref:Uncharacterized protein n=1 Tax=Ilex paraguariensis TaxID=185542 RepID=A0ABC8TNQ3_9AQUA
MQEVIVIGEEVGNDGEINIEADVQAGVGKAVVVSSAKGARNDITGHWARPGEQVVPTGSSMFGLARSGSSGCWA